MELQEAICKFWNLINIYKKSGYKCRYIGYKLNSIRINCKEFYGTYEQEFLNSIEEGGVIEKCGL